MTETSSMGSREPVILAHVEPFRLGSITVEPSACSVHGDPAQTKILEPRVMQVLVALVRATGAPVTRDELIASCWGGRFVSNDAVSRVISILRSLMLEISQDRVTIETLNKVGYRLIERKLPTENPAHSGLSRLDRRSVVALAGGAFSAAIGAAWLKGRHTHAVPRVFPRRTEILMVMPFTADANDRELVSIASDASEAMRNYTGRVPGLRVLGELISDSVTENTMPIQQLLMRTGATLTLSARLDRTPVGLRAILILDDLTSGQQLWSGLVAAPADAIADLLINR